MQPRPSTASTAAPAKAAYAADGSVGGSRQALARAGWSALALAAVVLFALAIPSRLAQLQTLCSPGSCAPGQVASGTSNHSDLAGYALALVTLDVVFALVYIAVALVIFWRRSDGRMALFVALMLVFWGTTFTATTNALAQLHPALFVPVASARFLGAALITLFFYLFPDGRFAPPWTRWLAAVWVFSQVPGYFWPESALNPPTWPIWLYYVVSVGFLAVMIAVQTFRYRSVSTLAERQQTKWVVLGIAVALVGWLAVLLLGFVMSGLRQSGTAAYVLDTAATNAILLAIPVSLGIAILRERLYDIDLLINRTLVYGALTSALALLYAVSVFALGALVRGQTGQGGNSFAIVVSTLGVAAAFQPLRIRIQRTIDRRFYRRRYDAARALAAFSATLHREVDLDRLSDELLAVVRRTMEPAHASLWLRASDSRGRTSE